VVKLADFGIARVVPEQVNELESSHGSSGNSIAIASPEALLDDFYFFPTDI
jgi:hypothetical protein